MADNGNVIIRILADTSDFEKDLARAKKGLIALGAAASAFAVSAIKSGSAIELELTKASLAAGETLANIKAGTGVFKQFESAAVAATRNTMFSSNDAAAALTALAKAGLDADTAIATLPAVLNMAQAGELDLGNAAESLVNIMSSLGIGVDDAKVAIDQMAKAADATTADMSDIIDGMARIGSMGKQASGGTKELSAALAILRQNGIDAGAAGTSLRNIYTRLLGGNKQAADAFKELGVATRDSAGNLRPLADILDDLGARLNSLGAESRERYLTEIFDVFNATSARNLMDNVDALRALESELDKATGFAARQSEALGASFQGQLNALNKAYKDLGNTLFGKANPAMKDAVGNLTEFLDAFAQSDEIKNFGKAISDVVSSLSEMGQKVLPTVVSITNALASAVSFAARNITAIIAAFTAYEIKVIAATIATKGFWTTVRAGLISTGVGAAFVALGFIIQSIIDNFDLLSIRVQQAYFWVRKLFAGDETSRKIDKKLADLDKRLQDIRKSAKGANSEMAKIGKDSATDKAAYNYNELSKNLTKYQKKVQSLQKEIARAKKENLVTGYAEIKSLQQEAAEYQKIIDGILKTQQDVKVSVGGEISQDDDFAKKIKDRWRVINEENKIGSDAWKQSWIEANTSFAEQNTLVERNKRILEELRSSWNTLMIGLGDGVMEAAANMVAGQDILRSAMQGILDNMIDIMSNMGDVLIREGTIAQLMESLALTPPQMIAAGIAFKVLAGAMKGMIMRQQAGHYAQGGIVPGKSYAGDNVPAYVNSGELILNRAQQDNIAKQLTASPAINIQVINNAGADVSVQQGANINDVIVMIDQRIEQYVGSQQGARAIKAASQYRGY